jgi:hypothetical protein
MQYQLKKTPTFTRGQFATGTQAGRTGGQGNFQSRTNSGNRPVNGEVISQDDKSITVKMSDGSSKIILLSEKTVYNKTSEGSKSDVTVGDQITAFGSSNPDGSITAQMIGVGQGILGGMMRGGQPQASESPMMNK